MEKAPLLKRRSVQDTGEVALRTSRGAPPDCCAPCGAAPGNTGRRHRTPAVSLHREGVWSRNLLLALAGLGVFLAASSVAARPLTCDQLLKHPAIEDAARASGGSAFRVTDLSSRHISQTSHARQEQRQALTQSFVNFRDSAQTLRVLAIDLPPNAPLVEVTCAIGRRIGLSVDETLIVITSFGMHAYSGSLTYHELRQLARRHNARLGPTPLLASARYAADIHDHIARQRRARHLLALLSTISFLLAAIGLTALLRAPVRESPKVP